MTALDLKEMKFRPNIEDHDYGVKMKKIKEFLSNNDKVKIVIFYRGREIVFANSGIALVGRIEEDVKDLGYLDGKIERAGRRQVAIFVPLKK